MVSGLDVGMMVCLLVVGSIFVLLSTTYVVQTGEVGIMTVFGRAQHIIQPSFGIKIPFVNHVVTMPTRVVKLQTDCDSASKDLQTLTTTVAINYRIDPTMALNIFENLGLDFSNTIISPAIEESVKSATAEYTADQAITQREKVKTSIKDNLEERLSKYGLVVTDVNIVNFQFSDRFNNAIEAKQVAEQEAQEQERVLKRIEIEAKQKIVTAEADANATLLMAEADAKALSLKRQVTTPDLVKLAMIEKWNGVMPLYTTGDMFLMRDVE